MQIPRNEFKHALARREPLFGIWLGWASPYTAEAVAGTGFDWMVIDGEHVPNDVQSILAQLQAVAPYPSHPVVRPVCGEVALIKQLLDIGAQTLLIPMVETGEQAAQMVAATRYPPQGTRGVGSALARASRWSQVDRYLHCANDEMCLLVQVETATAIANLEAIAATDGVDGVFFGPSDLSASLGLIGEPAHPDVMKVIDAGIATTNALGKAAGVLAADPKIARHYLDQGARFVAVGIDTILMVRACRELAASYKAARTTPPHGSAFTPTPAPWQAGVR
jgi:4-hydroxy-2-oxoheptanedioate aldolase